MHEMLIHNWLTSIHEPRGIETARKRVWMQLEPVTQPSLISKLWIGFAWFFMQPMRTAAFTVALLVVAVTVGHIVPTQLRMQQWHRTQALLDIEMSILEEENQLLEYVLE